jgi:hypothetical protein
MNKIKLFAAALAIGALSFSCSSDDSENLLGGDLTAKWNPTKTVFKVSGETYDEEYSGNQAGCDKDYVEFTDANMVNNVVYIDPAGAVSCEESAEPPVEYVRNDNTLIIADGEYGGTYEIVKLTSSELRLQQTYTIGSVTTEATIYFRKAAVN